MTERAPEDTVGEQAAGQASLFRDNAVRARSDAARFGDAVAAPMRPGLRRGRRVFGQALSGIFGGLGVVRSRAQRLRYVPQMDASDCAAACLATVLDFHGRQVDVKTLRGVLETGAHGTSARKILHVARAHGLVARGVQVDVDDLDLLPRGSILHWNLNHFVVLDSVGRGGVTVVDPQFGERVVPMSVVDRTFSGVALVFEGRAAGVEPQPVATSRWSHLRPLLRDPALWRVVVVTTLLTQVLVLTYPLLLRHVVDEVIPNERTGQLHWLWVVAVVLLVGHVVVLGARAIAFSWYRGKVDYRVTLAIFEKLFTLPVSYFEQHTTGDLMLRIRSTTALRQTMTTTVLSGLVDGPTALVLLAVVTLLDRQLAVVTLVVVAVQCMLLALAWRRQRDLTAAALESQAISQGRLVQVLSGAQTVKEHGAETAVISGWAQLAAGETNSEIARSVHASTTQALLNASRLVGPVVLLLVGTFRVLDREVATGAMVAATALAATLFTPVTNMLANAFEFAAVAGYLARINDIFDHDSESLRTGSDVAPTEGRIELHHVSFGYAGGSTLLRDIDLVVPSGGSAAILGGSGSGKSTLARLIAGTLTPSAGVVRIDGVDVSDYVPGVLRERLGYVAQHPHFFGGTIRDNITMFRDVDDESLAEAVRVAHLADDIGALPAGFETPLAERGESLSGGQLQRLTLARAILGKPRLLVLDEATSALDPTTETAVLDRILELGVTTVIITHRQSVADRVNDVYVLRDGTLERQANTSRDVPAEPGSADAPVPRAQAGVTPARARPSS